MAERSKICAIKSTESGKIYDIDLPSDATPKVKSLESESITATTMQLKDAPQKATDVVRKKEIDDYKFNTEIWTLTDTAGNEHQINIYYKKD